MNRSYQAARHFSTRLLSSLAAIQLLAGAASAVVIQGNVSCSDTVPATPIPNVLVIAAGSSIAPSSLTDSNGNYSISFTAVIAEPYQVHLANLPAGLTYVSPANGTNLVFALPDDPIPHVSNFVLSGCGTQAPGDIGGWVWEDLNCDGLQDWDEPGMPDVEVRLTDCDGEVLTNAWTDADGYYVFTGLAAGDYSVLFVAPPAYGFSPAGGDSEADPATGATPCFSLASGETSLTWAAGLCPLEAPGVRGQGYWKNHPDNWPVEQIDIGGVTYDKCDAILIMQLPTRGDKSLNMFEQLVATKLNVLLGNEADCIEGTIVMADLWMEMNPQPVPARSPAWKNEGAYLCSELDAYNNGWLCAPSAQDD